MLNCQNAENFRKNRNILHTYDKYIYAYENFHPLLKPILNFSKLASPEFVRDTTVYIAKRVAILVLMSNYLCIMVNS